MHSQLMELTQADNSWQRTQMHSIMKLHISKNRFFRSKTIRLALILIVFATNFQPKSSLAAKQHIQHE